jgi:hypothetical protein
MTHARSHRSPHSRSDELVHAGGFGEKNFGVLELDVMVLVE